MKVPYEWLQEFVVMDTPPHELARKLTMRGLEVESVEEYAPSLDNVVVGKIVSHALKAGAKEQPQTALTTAAEQAKTGSTKKKAQALLKAVR